MGRPRQLIGAPLAHQDLCLDQRPDALLEEEWVPLGPLDQQSLERPKARVRPRARPRELLGALGGQRVDAELPVVALPAPAVLILGSVVHQEQETRGREALHQAVQEGLRFSIDPVQVLEHDQEWLDLALPQEQPLYAFERPLAALRGFQPLPLGLLDRHIEEPQQRREVGLQRPVKREQLARQLLADLARVITCLDLEIGSKRSMSGRYADALPYETELLSTISQPCVRCERVNSQ